MKGTLRGAWIVFLKDARSEFRTRYALSAILLFAVASVALAGFVLRGAMLDERQAAAVVWLIVFFAAATGLARPFVQEAESGTELLLRQAARPEAVWLGKFAFSLGLMAAIELIVFPLFGAFLGVDVRRPGWLAAVAAAGAVSLSGATTILAAMVAKARARSSVFAVAALPVLLPPLVLLVEASGPAFGVSVGAGQPREALLAVMSYSGILIVLSWFLFPAVWEE